jgi:hypothetical protein
MKKMIRQANVSWFTDHQGLKENFKSFSNLLGEQKLDIYAIK